MESWQWTALLLCGFGLFKEFRPSEPFFTEYILQYKNISSEVLIHKAYPVSTYSYLGTLTIVFLVTDFLRYRSVIILEGLAYVACWTVIIWGYGLNWLYCVEFLYGLACSTEIAYYTYIYAKVDKEHYKKVTSYTYSAILTGRFLGGVFAQLLVSFELLNYHELNYISLACVSLAFSFSLFLPSVQQSIYFYRDSITNTPPNNESSQDEKSQQSAYSTESINAAARTPVVAPAISHTNTPTRRPKLTFTQRLKKAYPILWADFQTAYSNFYVLKWSLWWAIAMAGHLQIINYIQLLWETIAPDQENSIYNGGVEAVQCGLSAIGAFGVGYIKIRWFKWGEILLCIISLLEGGSLVVMSQTTNIWIAYVSYVVFRTCFQVTITIASSEIAQKISEDSYGLVFGINTFIALSLQTLLTVAIVDEIGLALQPRSQFVVYGCCYGVLGVVFIIVVIYTLMRHRCKFPKEPEVIIASGSRISVFSGSDDESMSSSRQAERDSPQSDMKSRPI